MKNVKNENLEENQTNIRQLRKCGDIMVSGDKQLVLTCVFCEKRLEILDDFLNHLLNYHFLLLNNIKTEIQLESNLSNAVALDDYIADDCDVKNKEFLDVHCLEIDDAETEGNIINSELNETQSEKLQEVVPKPIRRSEPDQMAKEVAKGFWKCNVCQIVLKKGLERRLHEKTHKGIKKLICETCGKGYTSTLRLADHVRTHTGEKPYKCRFCPKTFFSYSSMKSHDKTHIGFKPFKCKFCNHQFLTKWNQKIHEKNHCNQNVKLDTAETNASVSCNLCNKNFKCPDYLTLHLKRHEEKLTKSSPKPFECNFCPSTFISKANKNAHERLYHKGEYNYKCDYCGKVFLKLNKKRQHEEMHTRVEKSYKCDLCERKYARPEGLKKHKMTKHTKESPYKCKICEMGFESIMLFKEHCKRHNDEDKLHGCNYCEARFDTPKVLERHLKKMHKSTNFESEIENMASVDTINYNEEV